MSLVPHPGPPQCVASQTTPPDDGIVALGVLALAERIRRRELSARAVVDHYLDRVTAHNARLNALWHVAARPCGEAARRIDAADDASLLAMALPGIPLAIKDNIAVRDMPWTNGLGALRARRASSDAAVVARLRAAGAVIIGKSAMHEAALGATNDNPHFGRTHNPWRYGCTPGGSSGGSAAAVAAGLAAAALGTDTMGSVRIPASYCGVVGWMPSPGRLSLAGADALAPSLDRVGVLARSVADAALVARSARDSASAGAGDAHPLGEPPARLRIGLLRPGADGGTLSALAQAADRLAAYGHRISALPWDGEPTALRRACLLIVEREAHACIRERVDLDGDGVSDPLRQLLRYGAQASDATVADARKILAQAAATVARWLDSADVVLLPTTREPAFAFESPAPSGQGDCTMLANIARVPAISVPVNIGPDGLPRAVQLMGRRADDHRLLALSGALETALASAPAILGEPARPRPDSRPP